MLHWCLCFTIDWLSMVRDQMRCKQMHYHSHQKYHIKNKPVALAKYASGLLPHPQHPPLATLNTHLWLQTLNTHFWLQTLNTHLWLQTLNTHLWLHSTPTSGYTQHPPLATYTQHPPLATDSQHPPLATDTQHPPLATDTQHPPLATDTQHPPPQQSPWTAPHPSARPQWSWRQTCRSTRWLLKCWTGRSLEGWPPPPEELAGRECLQSLPRCCSGNLTAQEDTFFSSRSLKKS